MSHETVTDGNVTVAQIASVGATIAVVVGGEPFL